VEIDPDAAAAYKTNVGVQPLIKDVRRVSGKDLLMQAGLRKGELTLLFGCPPCQSFTILRRAQKATKRDWRRNTLVREYLRLVSELMPRHIAFENVPGMLGKRGKRYLDELITGLRSRGYEPLKQVIDAADFGVPQHRRRLLIVASRVCPPQLPKPTHSASGGRNLMKHRTVRDTIKGLAKLMSGQADGRDPLHAARKHKPIAIKRLAALKAGQARDDLPLRLQLECHKNHDGHHDIYGRMWWDRPAPTLTTGCTNVTRGRFGHPEQLRAITLREALLLQGFPRRAVLLGSVEQMASQVGNAVPPPLTRRLGYNVAALDRAARKASPTAAYVAA
jgi:DNA (cytosine-5)-methyltransferase 1